MEGKSLLSLKSEVGRSANEARSRYDDASWLSLETLVNVGVCFWTFDATSRVVGVLSGFASLSGSTSYSSSSPLSLLGSTKCTTPLSISHYRRVGIGSYTHERGIFTHCCPNWNSRDCSAEPMSSPALNLTAVTGRKRKALPRMHGFLRSVQYLHFSESRNFTPTSVYIKHLGRIEW
jgi:hypothetical protein